MYRLSVAAFSYSLFDAYRSIRAVFSYAGNVHGERSSRSPSAACMRDDARPSVSRRRVESIGEASLLDTHDNRRSLQFPQDEWYVLQTNSVPIAEISRRSFRLASR